jgi:hypothetical protein
MTIISAASRGSNTIPAAVTLAADGSHGRICSPVDRDPASEVAAFLSAIFEPEDIVEIRTISQQTGIVRSHWFPSHEIPSHIPQLRTKNASGADIYAGANPRIRVGSRGDIGVKHARTLFVDQDPSNGFTTLAAFQEQIAGAGLPAPTVIVSSGHGAWAYWRLTSPIETLLVWRLLQRRLSALLQTDRSVINAERIVRVPGFRNHKEPVAHAYIWESDPTRLYPLELFKDSLPELPDEPIRIHRPSSPDDGLRKLACRGRVYAAKIEGVGEGIRNIKCFQIAGHISALVDDNGQVLTESEVLEIVGEFNRRCTPPLSDVELAKCVRSGMTRGTPRDPKPARRRSVAVEHAIAVSQGRA